MFLVGVSHQHGRTRFQDNWDYGTSILLINAVAIYVIEYSHYYSNHRPETPGICFFDTCCRHLFGRLSTVATTTLMYKGTTKKADLVRILRERDYPDDSARPFAKW